MSQFAPGNVHTSIGGLALLVFGSSLVVAGGLIATGWSDLRVGSFYEDWSAEDFGGYGVLQRRKLRSWFPGPETVDVRISRERFDALRAVSWGFEIRCPPIRPRSGDHRDAVPSPFSFDDASSGIEIYLSERLRAEVRTMPAPPRR